MTLKFHPLSTIFPPIEGQEFLELVEDIRVNGLRNPIDLIGGEVLEGRNRYRALEALCESQAPRGPGWGAYAGELILLEDLSDITLPWFRRFSTGEHGDPLAYVISQNLRRRHMDESQRAFAAAKLANLEHGGARRQDVQAANLPLETESTGSAPITQAHSAELLNVSERSVRAAVAVRDQGLPELQRAVERGQISISAAALAARLAPDKQRSIAAEAAAGNANVVAKVIKRENRATRERELGERQQALPKQKFGLIYADPEWRFKPRSDAGMDRAPENHYPTSPIEIIQSRDVGSIAADDCVLLMWATVPMLAEAFCVLDAWGFARFDRDPQSGLLAIDKRNARYVSSASWTKYKPGAGIGLGYWFRVDHEILLVATRGHPPAPAEGEQWRSVFDVPASEVHSQKPELVLEMIEKFFPTLPKIELNRRGPARPGWAAWGNESTEPQFSPEQLELINHAGMVTVDATHVVECQFVTDDEWRTLLAGREMPPDAQPGQYLREILFGPVLMPCCRPASARATDSNHRIEPAETQSDDNEGRDPDEKLIENDLTQKTSLSTAGADPISISASADDLEIPPFLRRELHAGRSA